MSTGQPLFYANPPRQLTKLELVDIRLLVRSTRPVLRYAPKKIEPCEPRK